MKVRIVTNNNKVLQRIAQEEYDAGYIDGSAVDVLIYGQRLIEHGWALAIDPLAGYNVVSNPYRTIFLHEAKETEHVAKDIRRLEIAIKRILEPKKDIGLTDELLNGYCELDYSIAEGVMGGLLKNIKYV